MEPNNLVQRTMAMKEMMFFFLLAFTLANAEFQGSSLRLFVSELSGKFNNENSLKQLKESGFRTNQDLINVYVYPINNIPALKAEFTSYLEEWIGDRINRQHILALAGKGDIIGIKQYNLVHPESYVPGTFNISSLENLTLDDIKSRDECRVYVQRTHEVSFIGEWPDCTSGNAQEYYTLALNCNSFAFSIYSSDFPESKSRMPYDLTKFESFPVPDMPDYEIYRSYCSA